MSKPKPKEKTWWVERLPFEQGVGQLTVYRHGGSEDRKVSRKLYVEVRLVEVKPKKGGKKK